MRRRQWKWWLADVQDWIKLYLLELWVLFVGAAIVFSAACLFWLAKLFIGA